MTLTNRCIHPFKYQGRINANVSKSYFQRAMAIAALAEGKSVLKNIKWSADTVAVRSVIQQLGAQVNEQEDILHIKPSRHDERQRIHLNVGESGLALRMFSSIAALFDIPVRISGEGSLLDRPIGPIIETLRRAGVHVEHKGDRLPIDVSGPFTGGVYTIDGSFSSQILTGLLISAPLLQKDSVIHVTALTSKPYIDMTLDIMRHFGVLVTHENYEVFRIPGLQSYQGTTYTIEGDWSGAANHVVGAAISGEVTLSGLNQQSSQADRAIIEAIIKFGAHVEIKDEEITVRKNHARPFYFDATQCPDIFPPLVILAAAAKGKSSIKGTDRLIHKESNRLDTLMMMLSKFGVHTATTSNTLIVHGIGKVSGTTVDSFNDHRIAMAAAIASTISETPVCIENPNAISKSYPNFYNDLDSLSLRE